MDIQFSHNEGGLIASALYDYFRIIPESMSCIIHVYVLSIAFIIENRVDVHSAYTFSFFSISLKQHNEMNSNRWLHIQETRSLHLTPTKTPPSTNYSLFLHSQPLSSPSKSDDTQSPVKSTVLLVVLSRVMSN